MGLVKKVGKSFMPFIAAGAIYSNAAAQENIDSGYSQPIIPQWSWSGQWQEQKVKGYYPMIHPVLKEDTCSSVAKTYDMSVDELKKATGNQVKDCTLDDIVGNNLYFNVPVENFDGDRFHYIPYDFERNYEKIKSLSGDEFCSLRDRYSPEWLSFTVGTFQGDVYYGEESLDAILNEMPSYYFAAQQFPNVDVYELLAVVKTESGGKTNAISRTGAMGSNQMVMDIYCSGIWSDGEFRESINPFDVPRAAERSADFLNLTLSKGYSLKVASMVYHDGETSFNKNGPSQEALKYSEMVMRNYDILKKKFPQIKEIDIVSN